MSCWWPGVRVNFSGLPRASRVYMLLWQPAEQWCARTIAAFIITHSKYGSWIQKLINFSQIPFFWPLIKADNNALPFPIFRRKFTPLRACSRHPIDCFYKLFALTFIPWINGFMWLCKKDKILIHDTSLVYSFSMVAPIVNVSCDNYFRRYHI